MRLKTFYGNPPRFTKARLASDVSAGGWTPSIGGSLYGCLDEVVADDGDYIRSAVNPVVDVCEIKFSDVPVPSSHDSHALRYRIKGDSGTKLEVQLWCGATMVAYWVHDPAPADWTTYNGTIPTNYVDLYLTDYSDLRVKMVAG